MINLRNIVAITIIIAIGAIFMFSTTSQEVSTNKEVYYTQQASELLIHVFKDDDLVRTTSAKKYLTFQDESGILSTAKITTSMYSLFADTIIEKTLEDIELSGNINITYTDSEPHRMISEQLFFNPDTQIAYSNIPTIYYYNDDEIQSHGIKIDNDLATVDFFGTNTITLKEYNILTANTNIDNNNNNLYQGNSATWINSIINDNKTFATKGFKLIDKNIALKGLVDIDFDDAKISSINMNIDTVNNRYTSDRETNYRSDNIEIKSQSMIYDEITNTIHLNEDVQAIYN